MNSPVVVAWFALAAGLLIIGGVFAGEYFAAMTAERLADVADPDGVGDSDPHLDPNECRCGDCAEMVARIRLYLADEFNRQRQASADLDEIRSIASLPVHVRGGNR